MLTKAQHARQYRVVPPLLREIREQADLTQRELGTLLDKPQSWIHNCETANRRVDVTEFVAWCTACGIKPQTGLSKVLDLLK